MAIHVSKSLQTLVIHFCCFACTCTGEQLYAKDSLVSGGCLGKKIIIPSDIHDGLDDMLKLSLHSFEMTMDVG